MIGNLRKIKKLSRKVHNNDYLEGLTNVKAHKKSMIMEIQPL